MTESRVKAGKTYSDSLEARAMGEIGTPEGGGSLDANIIRLQIEQIIAEDGIPRARIASAVGISTSTMSLFMQNKYGANDKNIRERITAWLRTREMKATITRAEFVRTSIAREIGWVLSRAHANNVLGLVIGPSGIGKDMAIYDYAERTGGGRVAVVECDPQTATTRGILRDIAKTIGVPHLPNRHGGWNFSDIRDAIVEKLTASRSSGGAGILLVLNESHLLDYPAVETFRRLLDKSGTGGVLVGTARLATQLAGKGRLMYEQLRRRCQAVRAITQTEAVPVEDVRMVAESVAGCALNATVIGMLHGECNSQEAGHLGKLGRVAALVRQAMDLAGRQDIKAADIDNASKLLAA